MNTEATFDPPAFLRSRRISLRERLEGLIRRVARALHDRTWELRFRWRRRKSNLYDHALCELGLLGMRPLGPRGMNRDMCRHLLDLVEVFAGEGHSGFSASYATGMFEKLARLEPASPLTGEPAEWFECAEGFYQNKRCSHVFKENGRAYDIDGRIFREPDGGTYTNRNSRVPVTFPYVPKHEYVDVAARP